MKEINVDFSFTPIDPSKVGMRKEKLDEMNKIIPLLYKNLNGIMVIRQNQIVFEHYYHGFNKDDTQHIASVTKIGRAHV